MFYYQPTSIGLSMLKQTILFIFTSSHFPAYFILLLIFLLLTVDGFFLLLFFLKTKNKLLLVGGGMIAGTLGFLISLMFLSYLIKPPAGIIATFICYNLACFILYYLAIGPKKLFLAFCFKITFSNVLLLLLLLFYSLFIFVFINGSGYAGDVNTYWSLGSSFARGNYPTVSPWQPNYLSAYHQGTIMILGSLHALTGLSMVIVHYFFLFI